MYAENTRKGTAQSILIIFLTKNVGGIRFIPLAKIIFH